MARRLSLSTAIAAIRGILLNQRDWIGNAAFRLAQHADAFGVVWIAEKVSLLVLVPAMKPLLRQPNRAALRAVPLTFPPYCTCVNERSVRISLEQALDAPARVDPIVFDGMGYQALLTWGCEAPAHLSTRQTIWDPLNFPKTISNNGFIPEIQI